MSDLKTIELKLAIAAPANQIFTALTQTEELTHWFSEHADVSLAQNRYDFWGQFTPETPDRAAGRHELLAAEPNSLLQFKWHLRGVDTTVTYRLEPQERETLVTLRHEGVRPYRAGEPALSDFWSPAMENLRGWVERESVASRLDFGTVPKETVTVSVEIDGSKEAVFEALTSTEQLQRYIGEGAQVEPVVGGRYDYNWDEEGPAKILELVPNEKLVTDWTPKPGTPPGTIVTWTLEGSGGRTRLTLVHSGFAGDVERSDYLVGWNHFLTRIKFLVELGPDWQKPVFIDHDY